MVSELTAGQNDLVHRRQETVDVLDQPHLSIKGSKVYR